MPLWSVLVVSLSAASSSRSQVALPTASAAACPTWAELSVNVRWRPRLAMAIVTHLGTRPVMTAELDALGGTRIPNLLIRSCSTYIRFHRMGRSDCPHMYTVVLVRPYSLRYSAAVPICRSHGGSAVPRGLRIAPDPSLVAVNNLNFTCGDSCRYLEYGTSRNRLTRDDLEWSIVKACALRYGVKLVC